MALSLTPSSITTVKAVVNFSRLFNADLVKITTTEAAAIDDIPSLFIMFSGTVYDGPDLLLNRLRDLSQRMATDNSTVTIITGGVDDKPKSLDIKSGRATMNFRLASGASGDRIPSKFKGSFLHELEFIRKDLTDAVQGATAIGADTLTFISDTSGLQLTASSETETFTLEIPNVPCTEQFQYNYSVPYLAAVDKIIPKSERIVAFSVTAKGHMRVQLPTESPQITAAVFLLDIKNR